MDLLANKVCVITGAAGSIGLASAKRFLDEGARVMLVDSKQEALRQAAESLAGQDDQVAFHAADVREARDVEGYITATTCLWGKIDVLFSNAGTISNLASRIS